jgi:hypothetical protein
MAVIGLEYPQQFDVSEERLNLWTEILGHCDYRVAQEATIRTLSKPSQWPPKAGELLVEAKAVALEWARERRKEHEAREEQQNRIDISPEEAEAGRQRGLSILRDCIAKMEAKKAGVK